MSRPSIHALFLCAILPLLLCVTVSAQIIGNAEPEVSLTSQDTQAIAVTAGSAATVMPFTVDPGSGVGGDSFDVISSHPQIVITLITPSGTEITASNAESLGATYIVASGEDATDSLIPTPLDIPGTHTFITLPLTAPAGIYQIKINASGATDDALIMATYFSSSTVRAGAITDASIYRVGNTVVISGLLFDASTPITNATITAVIGDPLQPDTLPVEITLQDSGDYDAATGDGIYTGTFIANRTGEFTVAMRATGISTAGVAFSRVAGNSFRVIQPLANFVSFQDAGIDDNGNNQLDRVVVLANIAVQTAGRYQFGLTLVATNGARLQATAMADLLLGAQQLSVSFSAPDILRLGGDGPYEMTDALLTFHDDAQTLVADYRETAGQTASYSRAALERPALRFTGQHRVTGVDTNGNGKFDLLRVQAEVEVAGAGFYEWSGGLTEAAGPGLTDFGGRANLSAGTNLITFDFDGGEIRRHNVNGPYAVRSVLLYGAGASVIVEQLLETEAFSVEQFEPPPPPLNLGAVTATATGGDGDTFIEAGESGSLLIELRNGGADTATDLTATLTSATPGVTITGGVSTYADLAPSGSGVNGAPLTFELAGDAPCGQLINFILTVRYLSGGVALERAFSFGVPAGQPGGSVATVGYTGPAVEIPDDDPAGVNVPLTVSGFSGNIGDLNFRVGGSSCTTDAGATTVGLDHTYVGDLVVTLISPRGTTATLIEQAGEGGVNFCQTLLDDEGGGSSIQDVQAGDAPFAGTYRPANPLSAFRGEDPNGTWTLNVSDHADADIGHVRAFSLIVSDFQCDPARTPLTDLALTMNNSPDPVTTGAQLTYTITVNNAGPDTAMNVVVADQIPETTTFVSATASQGSCSGTTRITCELGTIASGVAATVAIVVVPMTVGALTNTASVSGGTSDPNGLNNTAMVSTTVTNPVPTPTPPPTPTPIPTPASVDGKIAFHSFRDGDTEV